MLSVATRRNCKRLLSTLRYRDRESNNPFLVLPIPLCWDIQRPNITGTLSPLSAYGKMAPWQVNGVFSLKNLSAKVYDVDVISGPDSIIFDANLSSSIYKKQDGIQVDAFQILMIIKV